MLNQKQLGQNLREVRERLGFSQEFVAKELDINRQAIIGMESGKRKIDSFELFKLADFYNVNVSDLMSKQEPVFSSLGAAVLHLRKNNPLSEKEMEGLLEFQKICDDYESLKKL